MIARLPRDQSEAVLLRVVVGLDAISAAKVLGKRPGAVRTACYRGLRRLSRWVEAGDGDLATAADRGPAPVTQSSVVVYLPAWMTVGDSPCAMIAGLPPSSKPVTILFTAVPFTRRYRQL